MMGNTAPGVTLPAEMGPYSSVAPLKREGVDIEPSDDEGGADFSEFLALLRRRRKALFITMLLIFAVSVAVAVGLPTKYRSVTTIVIEQQGIPSDFVRSTVTSFADQRIKLTTQRALSSMNMLAIIENFDLYPMLGAAGNSQLLAKRFNQDFTLELIRGDVRDPISGDTRYATVAFTLSYDGRTPLEAQQVANVLASLYLEDNQRARAQVASDTARFVMAEADALAAKIDKLEAEIADFKMAHMGRLPEQLDLNLQLMARTDQQLITLELQIRALEERKIVISAAMDQVKSLAQSQGVLPVVTTAPEERLIQLKMQYLRLSALYASDHPDVLRLRKEIEALEYQVNTNPEISSLEAQLSLRTSELAVTNKRYSAEHPDVKKLKREIAGLQDRLKAAEASDKKKKQKVVAPVKAGTTQPAYIGLESRLKVAQTEVVRLRAEQANLQVKFEMYEKRIGEIPETERQYSLLLRDHENMMLKYQEAKSKLASARSSEALERDSKGERFLLLEPAQLPARPFKPNRPKILSLGLFSAVIGGLVLATLVDVIFKAVHGSRGIIAVLGVPPLAAIPHIDNPRDRLWRTLKKLLVGMLILAIAAGAVALVHYGIVSVDELWESAFTLNG
jgi:uncharacterized protein involved in exopolysaccharide biosynthesis